MVLRVLLGYYERSSQFIGTHVRNNIFKEVLNRSNVDLLLNALELLEPAQSIYPDRQNSSRWLEKTIESLAYFPLQKSNLTSYIASLRLVETFKFDLRPDPTEQKPAHPGFSVKQMQDDKRKPNDIAEEFVGKESKLNTLELKSFINAFSHVLLARATLDSQYKLKLQLLSLRSLRYKMQTNEACPALDDKNFLQEAL